MRRRSLGLLSIVAFGYAFLYLPILSVMIYSFNDSRLVTLWGGFSLRWYAHLLEDEEVLEAALLSLRIAAVSATVATCLGALVALAMQRLTRLRGRLLLAGMITAGKHGAGVLSVASYAPEGLAALSTQWQFCEQAAAKALLARMEKQND